MNYRAKLSILNYITTKCLSVNYGDGINRGGFDDNYFMPCDYPKQDDLVVLQSAPYTEWYLSWYKQHTRKSNRYTDSHLLESIETGKLCNWSNISFMILNRDILKKHPEWKWNDNQFKFGDRWNKVCNKNKQSFHLYDGGFTFDGNKVTLIIRYATYLNKPDIAKTFDNYKKVKVKDMQSFWDEVKTKE